jgi:hypothetical protein
LNIVKKLNIEVYGNNKGISKFLSIVNKWGH